MRTLRKSIIASAIILVLIIILVHLFRAGNIFASYWAEGSHLADDMYGFLNDWAVVLSAAMTLLLAMAAFMTLQAMREQRSTSIASSLQVDRITPIFQRVNFRQFEPPKQVLDPTKTCVVYAELEVQASNLGSGAAMAVNISADVVIEFNNVDRKASVTRKLHFMLPKGDRDYYLEPSKSESRTFKLEFTYADIPDQPEKAGLVHCVFTYHDIDGRSFKETRAYSLSEGKYQIPTDDAEVIPGDTNYSTVS